ncbi:MAG: VWA domain-containing protein [Saprospirales bacterium]|nr:VWA domain-containing protein [Saprospirales bacterium]
MFRFEQPEYLYALLLVPLLAGLGIWVFYRRKWAMQAFGERKTLDRLMPGWSARRQWIHWIVLFLALSFLIVGWANPQWGSKRQKVTRTAADIILALDISPKYAHRRPRAQPHGAGQTLWRATPESLVGERIGLIVFAAGAYTQVPLTTDYGALDLFIKSSSPSQAPYQGTEIGAAIDLAGRLFDPNSTHHKALILLTDGETHDEDAMEKARIAKEQGVLLFTVAVGTEEGGFVPEWINGQKAFKKDQEGNPVRSQVNVEMLRNLAEEGGGQFFALTNPAQVIKGIQAAVAQLDRREMEERVYDEYESYFQYFIGIGLLLLMLDFFSPAWTLDRGRVKVKTPYLASPVM